MAYVNDNVKTQPQAVAGNAPLSQGGGTPVANEPMVDNNVSAPSQPSTIQSSSDQGAAGSGQNPSKSASSGMFTNIQKYINKNKPQAQNISKAVTKDFSKEAEQIRNVAQQKKQEQDSAIAGGRDILNKDMSEAQGIVNRVTQDATQQQPVQAANTAPQPAPVVPTFDQDIERYQKLMNEGSSAQSVNDINVAKESNRQQALSNLASTAKTEAGRRNLMQEAFGGARQYTRGQSSLDNLILGGDQSAKDNLIEGVTAQSDQTKDMLNNVITQSQDDVSNYNRDATQFKENVGNLASGASTGIEDQLQTAYDAEIQNRMNLGDNYENAVASAKADLDGMRAKLTDRATYSDFLRGNINSDRYSQVSNNLDKVREFEQTGTITIPGRVTYNPVTGSKREPDTVLKGDSAQRYLQGGGGTSITHHKDRLELLDLFQNVNKNLLGGKEDLYNLKGTDDSFEEFGFEGDIGTKNLNEKMAGNIQGSYDFFKNQIDSADSNAILDGKVRELTGGRAFSDILAGSDIDKYDIADTSSISKLNKLKQLRGNQDLIDESSLNRDYTRSTALKALFDKYTGEEATSDYAKAVQNIKRTGN